MKNRLLKSTILLIGLLVGVCSCFKSEYEDPQIMSGYFHDEYEVNDSTVYYMSCLINSDIVDMQCVTRRTETIDKWVALTPIGEFLVDKDTTLITYSVMHLSPRAFVETVKMKSVEKRETPLVDMGSELYFTWTMFDEIYHTVHKHF